MKHKDSKLVERYYFVKTRRGKVPIGTVYLMKKGEETSRGFALLSFRDALSIKQGKRFARRYAFAGLYGKKDNEEIKRKDAFDMLDVLDVPFYKNRKRLYKAMYNPKLSAFEKSLLAA